MNGIYYDIESLQNVFSVCAYREKENSLEVYLLCDNRELYEYPGFLEQMANRIYEKNRNFNGTITFLDLTKQPENDYMARLFGVSDANMVNDPNERSSFPVEFRPVCDTDLEYDENMHPYIFSYNGYNYDSTMLAIYFDHVYPTGTMAGTFVPISAHCMRVYNDLLFERFKSNMPDALLYSYDEHTKRLSDQRNYKARGAKIRKNMLLSGRHLDVARLNEKQQRTGLKRILGMLGYQILESDKLDQKSAYINTTDELLDLIAYNVSDVVNLKELMGHEFYQAQFTLKRELLRKYPELIYEKQINSYSPDVSMEHVRKDRLTIDSSSAQFSTKALCPYGHLTDIPVVSFLYPSKRKAKELGIPQINVLDETRKFIYEKFPQPDIRKRFDEIYAYYKSIEGKNFNASRNYDEDYRCSELYHKAEDLQQIPRPLMAMPYYNADGSVSRCYVNFSKGGIHGAEYNKELYDSDMEKFECEKNDLEYVKKQYPDPLELKNHLKVIMFPDGRMVPSKQFLTTKSTKKHAEYKDISKNKPELFLLEKKGTKLNPKYCFTSSDPSNHEDFKSYYPMLLMMLSAFYNNGLGYDRYEEIFCEKEKYGRFMKDSSLPEGERELYSILREGVKLILNSASGAADANYDTNIRMNNMIISMRIIGQLFSYRIGQAQTYEGAKITSTNTDGLYSVMDKIQNDQILEREAKDIGVAIEPEPVWLISKDANNRIELNMDPDEKGHYVIMGDDVIGASGGTVGCRKGPTPTKALSNPAIIDWALTEYLIVASRGYKGLSLSGEFSDDIGLSILHSAKNVFKPVEWLKMFQNVLASSVGSMNYIFGTTNGTDEAIILQHYNRVFILKDNTPHTLHLQAANGRKITDAAIRKRRKNNERLRQHDPHALKILEQYGVEEKDIPAEYEAVIKKVTNIEDDWYVYILNDDLHMLPQEEINFVMENIDYEKYLSLLRESFENNWRNKIPTEKKSKKKQMIEYINTTLQNAEEQMLSDVYAFCKGEINFL